MSEEKNRSRILIDLKVKNELVRGIVKRKKNLSLASSLCTGGEEAALNSTGNVFGVFFLLSTDFNNLRNVSDKSNQETWNVLCEFWITWLIRGHSCYEISQGEMGLQIITLFGKAECNQ